jgi:putative endonuclease
MHDRPEKVFHVYIMASKPRGVLYVGMTSELAGRAWKHREHVLEGFTKRYWVDRLVYFECHDDARVAAQRERAMKRWRRDWKIEPIERHNPIPDLIRDGICSRTWCGPMASSGDHDGAGSRIASANASASGTQGERCVTFRSGSIARPVVRGIRRPESQSEPSGPLGPSVGR